MDNTEKTDEQLMLIDTDAGLDDATAILMALAHPRTKVVAITTVQGNTDVKQVSRNVLRLLKVADRLDIPVFRGFEKSILGKTQDASYYHGRDGFGDAPDPDPPSENLLQTEHAVTALSRISKEYEGKLTLVCLGPLTNIAMALRLDPQFGTRLKESFFMGGNYRGFGNVTPTAEFNFCNDPEAAFIALRELGCPITLMPWEPCHKQSLPMKSYLELVSMPTPKAKFTMTVQQKAYFDIHAAAGEAEKSFILCDELAMACALDESIIKKCSVEYATIALDGEASRGQMIVHWAWLDRPTEKRNVKIVKKVDFQQVIQLLRNAFS